MNWKALCRGLRVIPKFIQVNAPSILSMAGAFGVAATGVASAAAGYKDAMDTVNYGVPPFPETEDERVRRRIRTYMRPVLIGGASIACIFAGDTLHAKRYAALGAAAGVIEDRYFRMKKELGTWHGKAVDADDGSEHELPEGTMQARAAALADHTEAKDLLAALHTMGVEPYDTHTGSDLWYEPFSKTFFLASTDHVTNAEYHTNRNFRLRGESPLSEFLRFLELPAAECPGYDLLHWDEVEGETIYGYSWIDFLHQRRELPDGTTYWQIFYPFEPHLSER